MRMVIDANILAAALIRPTGHTARRLAGKDRLYVPQQAEREIRTRESEFATRAGITVRQFRARLDAMFRDLIVVPEARLSRFARHPLVEKVGRIDPDDRAYVATYIAAKADYLWTRDRILLETLPGVAVMTPPHSQA